MKQFIVGPVEMYPSTKKVLETGYTYFRTDEYGNMVKRCLSKISDYLGNKLSNSLIYLAASGTGAMDAAVDNCITTKDKVLVINGGSFGHRFCEILQWHNIPFESIDLKWDETLKAEHLDKYTDRGLNTLFVNIDETQTGQLYDIELISDFCRKNNMFLVVDAISSFLADDYNIDKYGIDVTIISSQKGLCVSAGMSLISFSQRMIDKIYSNPLPKSYYFNFREYFKNIERGQTPFTPCVTTMYELNDMINLIECAGGKEAWMQKVKDKCFYFRKRTIDLGFKIPDYPKSNTLTPIFLEDVDASKVVKHLREKYQICVNPCGSELATKLLRVSHIGNTSIEDIDNLLEKLVLSIKEVKEERVEI